MKLNFNALTRWQQQIFSASLIQRMLPNYAYFSQAVEFGDYSVLSNQMDIIWQKLDQRPIQFNLQAQLEKLQTNIPQQQNFDMFAVYPAIDVCSGLVCLLESFEDKESRLANDISLLSLNSVKAYLSLRLLDEGVDAGRIDEVIESDSLFLWELETQQELYEFAVKSKPSQKNSQAIKAMSLSQRLTNLAIEY